MSKSTPISIVCQRLGCTEDELSIILGVVPSAVSNWKTRRDGRIPEIHYRKIFKEAKKRKTAIDLTELVVV